MNELIANSNNRSTRWKYFTGASVIALSAYLSSSSVARAEDENKPQLWIELGGQVERVQSSTQPFSPAFFANTPKADLTPMLEAEQPTPFSLGLEGQIVIEPKGTDWVLSASARYGRLGTSKHKHHQTPLPYTKQVFFNQIQSQPGYQEFGDGQSRFDESHLILDFQAGKDVGLGLFGDRATSVVSAGVRFAQLSSQSHITLNARPYNKLGDAHAKYLPHYVSTPPAHYVSVYFRAVDQFRHTYAASVQADQNFRGVGPLVSWTASLPVAGNESTASLNFDWGLNAAVLFGRQKTTVHHKTSGHHYSRTGVIFYNQQATSYSHGTYDRTSSRRVTIPNLGGFAGMTLKFPSAKVSFGYRADVFFGAVDGGIDTRRSYDRSFYGPFATISVGLGG